jgi:hypothetical protein
LQAAAPSRDPQLFDSKQHPPFLPWQGVRIFVLGFRSSLWVEILGISSRVEILGIQGFDKGLKYSVLLVEIFGLRYSLPLGLRYSGLRVRGRVKVRIFVLGFRGEG